MQERWIADKKDDEIEWQLRNSIIKEDDSNEWKKRRAAPLTDLQKLAKKVTFKEKGYTFYDEGQTRIMASLVPDEIIYNIGDYSKRKFSGCLLCGDVSGFTDLCEKYNKSGKGGPSRLTQVLNNYIGAMVQEILSHGGDVLYFSGDAFIALWKVTDRLSMKDAVHEALDCSLIIQKSYGNYQTDNDVVVRVKLAVAAGNLVFSLIGNEEISHYIMTGQPIYDIKAAESKSSAGEIIITSRVNYHINANEYLINTLPDGIHAKVLGVGPNWRNIQRQYDPKESRSLLNVYDDDSDGIASKTSLLALQAGMSEEEADVAARVVSDQYASRPNDSMRPAVNNADRLKLKNSLRRFIIAPVVRGIDAEEPLEYLTEIRQVTILFINCKVAPVDPLIAIDIANDVYITVCK
ncbi:hypothetical protein NQ318_018550 [Aromia moschata]|uniref:Guanylate cyclase domain-containing protein n=1 Tax=Aromia moschata TaxID=1265417 RepID=A0AAV8ZI68_9CUCU|nr:hypothetical protein NQ318_018550 [Aromia moschata]